MLCRKTTLTGEHTITRTALVTGKSRMVVINEIQRRLWSTISKGQCGTGFMCLADPMKCRDGQNCYPLQSAQVTSAFSGMHISGDKVERHQVSPRSRISSGFLGTSTDNFHPPYSWLTTALRRRTERSFTAPAYIFRSRCGSPSVWIIAHMSLNLS